MLQSINYVIALLLTVLAVVNVMLDTFLIQDIRAVASMRPKPLSRYSMKGSDYPSRLPIQNARRKVMMPVEDTIRYSIDNTEAEVEWLWTATVGDGNVRLGANQRFFSLAMVHEQHCMRWMRLALEVDELDEHQAGHMVHCLSYMRQFALCAADTTLEPADILSRNPTKERWSTDHECSDWPAIYATMRANYLEWMAVQLTWRKEVEQNRDNYTHKDV